MTDPLHRLRRAVVRRSAGTALLAVLVVAAGCTGDPAAGPGAGPTPPVTTDDVTTLDPRPAPARVHVTRVAGTLPRRDRAALADRVGSVVSSYFREAFLDVDREDPSTRKAFGVFTRDAATMARRQRALTSNASLAPTTEQVTPLRQDAYLSVLAVRGVPSGVTARVHLTYLAQRGERRDRQVTVTGRLLLTRTEAGWRVFGYDLARSARATGGA